MSNTESINWRILWKRFGFSIAAAMLLAVFVFFISDFIPEKWHGVLLIGAAAVLWCVCAWMAFRGVPVLGLLAVAVGLTWGFLFSLSAAISIMNHRVSVNWPSMIPGLLLVPIFVIISVLPFWYFGGKRRTFE